jgi:hypothetical protein
MDDRPFYYRVRGRTLGPVPLRQIRQLAQRAQIGRTTDISRDGVQWGKAGDWPEIFEAPAGADPGGMGGLGGDLGLSIAEPATPTVASGNWYYTVGGVQQGPVDLATLQRMVAAGQVGPSDHVFAEGGSDWVLVSSVPQLKTMAPTSGGGVPVINVNVPQPMSSGEGTNGLAIAGFILSLVGCAPLGLILSLVALNSKNRANRGLAIAGAIIGGFFTLCGCGYVVLMFVAAAANAQ